MEGATMEIKKLQELHSNKTKLIFTVDGKIFKASIIKNSAHCIAYLQNAGKTTAVNIPQSPTPGKITTIKSQDQLFSPALRSTGEEELVLKSPLAGLVVKIKATVGQFVEKNQPIVVIESMKMENEMSAPFSAFIKTLSISEGNLVKQNQVIVTFEKKGESDAATKIFCEQKVFER